MSGFEVVHLDSLDSIPLFDGLVWHPVRRRLGIRAFGINAYSSEAPGQTVVEEHDETGGGAGGHEELYVVMRGRAAFTIDGEQVDAPAGTLIFVSDPASKRVALAQEEGTVVLAIGGEPGRAYEVSPWEFSFAAGPLLKAGRWDEAVALIGEGLTEYPGNASLLYNLACAESQIGRLTDAVGHLQEAIRANPAYAEHARTDPDFDPIRAEPGLEF